MMPVNAFDVLLLVAAAALAILGLAKGAARLLFGVAALAAAFVVAARFEDALALALTGLGIGRGASAILAYVALFLATLVAGGFAGWLVSKTLEAAKLGWADRIGGASLGVVAAALLAAFVVHPIAASPTLGPSILGGSALAPYAVAIADGVNLAAPEDLRKRYREGVETVRRVWNARLEARREEAVGNRTGK